MMLTETLHAELAKIDAKISELNRARFRALGRCDGGRAKKLYEEMQQLRQQRRELEGVK